MMKGLLLISLIVLIPIVHCTVVIGHRGNPISNPENTMVSFRSALNGGICMVETDLRLTRDGIVVLMHDASVNRTTNGGNVLVKDLTWSQLEQLDAGSWFGAAFKGERVPSFDQLLQYVVMNTSNCGVIMDIKDHGIGWNIAQVVKKWNMEQRVVASCWTDDDMRDIARYLNVTIKQKLGSFPQGVDANAWVAEQRALGYHSFSLNYQTVTPDLIQACERNLIPLVTWTVDDADVALQEAADGVAAIITNVPLQIARVLSTKRVGLWQWVGSTLAVFSGIMVLVVIVLSVRLEALRRRSKGLYEMHGDQ